MLDQRPVVDTIFFGGGTPSLMEGETVASVLDRVANEFSVSPSVEVTLEANPTSVDWARFRDYRAAGVNRLSLGMQALNDADLKRLGRWHTAQETKEALRVAESSFDRVSLDLIYARPDQTPAAWRQELTEALAFGTEHLSLYQLTIEPNTPFKAQHDKGLLKIPGDDLATDLYELTQELCEAKGLLAYEISNHARPGAESRHNLVYWRYGDYLGIGPGAHGRLTHHGQKRATVAAKKPEDWLARVASAGDGYEVIDDIAPADQAREMLLMGLRLAEGIDADRYERLGGKSLDRRKIDSLISQGLLVEDGGRLAATAQGRLVLNAIIAALAG
jgi:oxygen-independent coproporphyrinogen-3 oxidase